MGKALFLRKGEVHTAPSGSGGSGGSGGLPTIGTPLNNFTWAQIRSISDAGVAANYFSVGDTKTIVINGKVGLTTFYSLSIDVFILGFDHNASVEGSNKIHFGMGKIGGVNVALCDSNYSEHDNASGAFCMNLTNDNTGGWSSSHMRKTVLGSDKAPASPTANTLLSALPSDLRAVMKSITKYSDNTGGGSNTASYVTATTDYLPLLAEFEVQGTRKYANSAEQNNQKQYEYYKAGNSKVKYRHNDTSSTAVWKLRSPRVTYDNAFCTVGIDGGTDVCAAGYSHGVAPAFAV